MKKVEIFTDGACSGNPGKGGWGAVLKYDFNGELHEKELSGFDPSTTNNRMELTAVIEALSSLKMPCEITLTTDSKYVVDSVNNGWLFNWQKKGWKNSQKQDTPNKDLWEQLLPLLEMHNITFVWVKGHAGHPENERCDELAVKAYTEYSENKNFVKDFKEKDKLYVKQTKEMLKTLINDLETGKLFTEDLGEENINRLKNILNIK